MGTNNFSIVKPTLLALTLTMFAACSSTGDVEDQQSAGGESAAGAGSGAQSSGTSDSGAPSAADLASAAALQETVFYFDFDVAEFKAEDRETLTFHAQNLAANPDRRVRLEGHADERGTREYNLALGERRANGIQNYLIVNGASRAQIEVVSYGEERPAEAGESENAYAMNRRVEIVDR